MADLRFAAWFLCRMPLPAALSRVLVAATRRAVAVSLSPALIASRVARIAVLTWLLTWRLRSCAFLLVPMRLICDLIFATFRCFLVCGSEMVGGRGRESVF